MQCHSSSPRPYHRGVRGHTSVLVVSGLLRAGGGQGACQGTAGLRLLQGLPLSTRSHTRPNTRPSAAGPAFGSPCSCPSGARGRSGPDRSPCTCPSGAHGRSSPYRSPCTGACRARAHSGRGLGLRLDSVHVAFGGSFSAYERLLALEVSRLESCPLCLLLLRPLLLLLPSSSPPSASPPGRGPPYTLSKGSGFHPRTHPPLPLSAALLLTPLPTE
jgi:hypothetical protein